MRGPRGEITPALARLLALCIALVLLWGPGQASAADAEVRRAQERLQALGYEPGPADGLMGPRTREAISAFQRDQGLPASGELDRATREALGLVPQVRQPEPAAPETQPREPPEPPPELETPEPPGAQAPAPQPAPAAGGAIAYSVLGWHAPESGAEALRRYRANPSRSPTMKRGHGEHIVPEPARLYVLERGERIPGFDCDPTRGRLLIEPLLGEDGPLSVKDLDGRGYCLLGFGVVLAVGETVEIRGTTWLDTTRPEGRARLTPEGLVFE